MEIFKDFDVKLFQRSILNWWKKNKRNFPWRHTRDPYQIIIAEVLLHRTRADQVVPVYQSFIEKFPSLYELATAPVNEIKEVLKSLGLFWRVELLHKMAKELVSKFNGIIPSSREELESLPGVSHYIASAVRCFAYEYPDALLDTNTVRICGRLFDIPVTDGSRRSRKFRNLLEALVDLNHPRDFNFALLDHGAIICRGRDPLCRECPVNQQCYYGKRMLNKNNV